MAHKMIISGKMYNTDTANEIANTEYAVDNDFKHNRNETLYQKKTGEYFLLAEYIPTTGYQDQEHSIEPFSDKSAMAWVEKWANSEYESIFGVISE